MISWDQTPGEVLEGHIAAGWRRVIPGPAPDLGEGGGGGGVSLGAIGTCCGSCGSNWWSPTTAGFPFQPTQKGDA